MSEKVKKIISTVISVFTWIFVAISVIVTVLVFAAQGKNNDGVPTVFGKGFITIQTPSMTGTFNEGDLVFMTKFTDEEKDKLISGELELDVGTIITYKAPIDINKDGKTGNDINTHRIYSHEEGSLSYTTKGDANPGHDNEGDTPYTVHVTEIIGTCKDGARLPIVGFVLDFLRTGLGFFLCIVLPLILLFLYEVYVFVSVLVSERAKKVAGAAKESEEEIKRRAIEEYIKTLEAQKAAAADPAQNAPSEENADNASDEAKD